MGWAYLSQGNKPIHEIRDFIGALHMGNLTSGYFVTTGKYSDDALKLVGDSRQTTVHVTVLGADELVKMGPGLVLSKEVIAEAKRRWNVPEDPPDDMPQGPRWRPHRRRYRRG